MRRRLRGGGDAVEEFVYFAFGAAGCFVDLAEEAEIDLAEEHAVLLEILRDDIEEGGDECGVENFGEMLHEIEHGSVVALVFIHQAEKQSLPCAGIERDDGRAFHVIGEGSEDAAVLQFGDEGFAGLGKLDPSGVGERGEPDGNVAEGKGVVLGFAGDDALDGGGHAFGDVFIDEKPGPPFAVVLIAIGG